MRKKMFLHIHTHRVLFFISKKSLQMIAGKKAQFIFNRWHSLCGLTLTSFVSTNFEDVNRTTSKKSQFLLCHLLFLLLPPFLLPLRRGGSIKMRYAFLSCWVITQKYRHQCDTATITTNNAIVSIQIERKTWNWNPFPLWRKTFHITNLLCFTHHRSFSYTQRSTTRNEARRLWLNNSMIYCLHWAVSTHTRSRLSTKHEKTKAIKQKNTTHNRTTRKNATHTHTRTKCFFLEL